MNLGVTLLAQPLYACADAPAKGHLLLPSRIVDVCAPGVFATYNVNV